MKKIIMTCVFWLLMAAMLAAPLGVIAQTSGDFMDPEEFDTRLNEADELTVGAKCSLPTPFLEEGYPITMETFDDWTRNSICIDDNHVNGVAWSAWPGDVTNKTQHFKAWWRLVDKETLEIVDETITDTTKDPRVSGPPKSILDWSRLCGPEREMVLLLDVSARQIINGVEIGLENRDHSWHFSLPQTICKIYIPFVSGLPEENPECPTEDSILHSTPADDVVLKYTIPGDTRTFVMQLIAGQTYRFETRKNGVRTQLPGAETTVYGEDGQVDFEFTSSSGTLIGGIDLGIETYTIESSFPWGNARCWNHIRLYDPPALAAKILKDYPQLSWDEAFSLASIDYKSLLETGLSSDDAYQALSAKILQ